MKTWEAKPKYVRKRTQPKHGIKEINIHEI